MLSSGKSQRNECIFVPVSTILWKKKKRLWRDAQNNKTNYQRCESCALPEAAKHPLLIPLRKILALQSPTCPGTGQHPGPQLSHAPTSYLDVLRIFVVEGLPTEADPWDTVGRSCVAGVWGPWGSNFHGSCYLWESLWWHFPSWCTPQASVSCSSGFPWASNTCLNIWQLTKDFSSMNHSNYVL